MPQDSNITTVSKIYLIVSTKYPHLNFAELNVLTEVECRNKTFSLHADLRFGPIRAKDQQSGLVFKIGVKEARLHFKARNATLLPGSIYADFNREAAVSIKKNVAQKSTRSIGASIVGQISASLIKVNPSAESSAAAETGYEAEELSKYELDNQMHRVIAEPFGWRFSTIEDDPEPYLMGRYLQAEMPLCSLVINNEKCNILLRCTADLSNSNVFVSIEESSSPLFDRLVSRLMRDKDKNRLRAIEMVFQRALRRKVSEAVIFESRAIGELSMVSGDE